MNKNRFKIGDRKHDYSSIEVSVIYTGCFLIYQAAYQTHRKFHKPKHGPLPLDCLSRLNKLFVRRTSHLYENGSTPNRFVRVSRSGVASFSYENGQETLLSSYGWRLAGGVALGCKLNGDLWWRHSLVHVPIYVCEAQSFLFESLDIQVLVGGIET